MFDRKRVLVTSTNWTSNSSSPSARPMSWITSDAIAEYFAGTFDLDWKMGLDRDAVAFAQFEIQQLDPRQGTPRRWCSSTAFSVP